MKLAHRLVGLMMVTSLAASQAIAESNLFWLSDVAPKKSKAVAQAGAHHGSDNMDAAMSGEESDTTHNSVKHVWLRSGDEIGQASYLNIQQYNGNLSILNAYNQRTLAGQAPIGQTAHVKLEFKELGFNNAYAKREQLSGHTLFIQLAKAEILKGSCCEREVAPEQLKAISDPDQPLEIVREHLEKEKLFTRMVSGDTLNFLVHSRGQPAAGVEVRMITQQGWEKKARTDEHGQVSFTLIRDYFPSWDDFKRRTKETFVVVAEKEESEIGAFQGEKYEKVRYQATLSGKYAPSPYDYKSYAYGLGIAVFVIAFGGLGVYLYRRRRVKPFQEIRYSEGQAS
jgi:hypothetical protein